MPNNVEYLFLPKNSGFKTDYSKTLIARAVNELNFDNVENVKILERRGEDIPLIIDSLYNDKGILSVGITGDDLFDEYFFSNPDSLLRVINTIVWVDLKAMFGRPVLALLGKNSNICIEDKILDLRNYTGNFGVPNKFFSTCLNYLESMIGCREEALERIFCLNGSVEEGIGLGLYDYCIDVVYSGKTINEVGLYVVDVVRACDISTIMPNINFYRG